MGKFVPVKKRSKKEQAKANALMRGAWTRCPVTRMPKNSRAYDRNKVKKEANFDE